MMSLPKYIMFKNSNVFYRYSKALKCQPLNFMQMRKTNAKNTLDSYRTIFTSPISNQPPSLVKMRRLQTEFQCDDGKPVYLKGGMKDRVLVILTYILCGIGLFNVVLVIYHNAKPTSWKQADKS